MPLPVSIAQMSKHTPLELYTFGDCNTRGFVTTLGQKGRNRLKPNKQRVFRDGVTSVTPKSLHVSSFLFFPIYYSYSIYTHLFY